MRSGVRLEFVAGFPPERARDDRQVPAPEPGKQPRSRDSEATKGLSLPLRSKASVTGARVCRPGRPQVPTVEPKRRVSETPTESGQTPRRAFGPCNESRDLELSQTRASQEGHAVDIELFSHTGSARTRPGARQKYDAGVEDTAARTRTPLVFEKRAYTSLPTMALRLAVLMLAPFAFGTGAYVFAGLLEPMALDLGASVPVVGQLQSAFAIASALGGPVLALATNRIERKRLLVMSLVGLATANAASAIAGVFGTLVVARIAAGLVGALTLPVASAIAVSLVGPERRAVGLAAVFSGMSFAFLIGIPLGSFMGAAYGWPASFWLATALALLACVAAVLAIPTIGQMPTPPEGALQAALRAPAKSLLSITFLSFLATFVSVAFIGPLITALTGLEGGGIGVMQLFIGIGSLIGLPIGARLAQRLGLRALSPLMMVVAVSQLLFSVGLLANLSSAGSIVFTAATIMAGSAALFALAPIVQSSLAAIAGQAATVAFALNGSVVFFGQGLGAVVGGGVIAEIGLTWTGLAGAGVALATLVVTQKLRSATIVTR